VSKIKNNFKTHEKPENIGISPVDKSYFEALEREINTGNFSELNKTKIGVFNSSDFQKYYILNNGGKLPKTGDNTNLIGMFMQVIQTKLKETEIEFLEVHNRIKEQGGFDLIKVDETKSKTV
jgi:hypothetical protein